MRFFLIGYMGSGKSYWTKSLSKTLNFPEVDMDQEIEHIEKMKIKDIFSTKGEPYFRNLETKILKDIVEKYKHIIISTGGGLPCHSDNMDYMNEHGITIYLKVPEEEIYNRLIEAKQQRPLLKNMSDEEIKTFISKSIKERTNYYEQARISLDVNNISEHNFSDILKSYA